MAAIAALASAIGLAVVALGGSSSTTDTALPSVTTSAVPTGPHHGHRMGDPQVPPPTVPRALRTRLQEQVARAARAVPWKTVAEAQRAGYRTLTIDPDHPDDHMVLDGVVDDRFEIDHPEMLVIEGGDPDDLVEAGVYWVEGGEPPAGFVGPSDVWHQHPGSCRAGDQVANDGEAGDPEVCRAHGGIVVSEGGWMIHAWVVEGFANRAGTFAVNDPDLEQQVEAAHS